MYSNWLIYISYVLLLAYIFCGVSVPSLIDDTITEKTIKKQDKSRNSKWDKSRTNRRIVGRVGHVDSLILFYGAEVCNTTKNQMRFSTRPPCEES